MSNRPAVKILKSGSLVRRDDGICQGCPLASSRPLIVTKSNLCLPNLIFGRVVWTFLSGANTATIHKLHYRPAYIERERKAGYLNPDSPDLIGRDLIALM
jgi:hypothetical protein